MSNEDILSIQRGLADRARAERIVQQQKLARDVRPMIARSGWYNPDNDRPYEHVEYPKYVKLPGSDKQVVAHDADEEARLMGTIQPSAKKIAADVQKLVNEGQAAPVAAKRGRPKKVAAQELPPPLE